MGKLREGVEGYEPTQHSNMLVDDINLAIFKKQSDYAHPFWIDTHHLIDEEERVRERRIETLIKKIDAVLENT